MNDQKLILRVAAKVVIEAEGGILALHPSEIDLNRNWQVPGGIRDDITESLTETAIREVIEEIGLDLSSANFKPFKIGEWLAIDQGEKVKILAVFFHVVLPSRPKVIISEEHDDLVWLDKDNYKKYQSNREVNEIIEEILS